MTMLSSNHCNLWLGIQNHLSRGRFNQIICPGSGPYIPSRGSFFFHGQCLAGSSHQSARRCRPIFSSTVDDGMDPDDSEDGIDKKQPSNGELGGVNSEMIRENLERIVGSDDSTFSGLDLATLIRNKYGRSYDVLLIKKRSFPLTEEEYLLRLDDVANTLKCWGAVSHIRNSLEKLKERPRIGKAVSIFIDMDESGGRSNEWIYK
ncbi:hypothetical protein PVL29_001142 [Vitis rotundifolia]|uniref:Uncharacterized protein n=1 Tax=Vitis rotundifolia TaxID=103349 RepID=A0AA39ALR9_VITRO|nr:hypothetical protein PVL29_001142 [Vitis rotundifolia]